MAAVFNTWILIKSLHLPPSPCQSSQRWAAPALGEAVSLCHSEDVVEIGGSTLGPPLGWRNRSTALQSNSHGGRHDRETSKGSRKCQGVKMMGPRLSAHTDVASNKQVLQETAHGSPPWLIFEPLRAAPPPFPSAPPGGERSENRWGAGTEFPVLKSGVL